MWRRKGENGHHRERSCDPLESADSGQAINIVKLLMFVEYVIFLACIQLYILSNGMLSGQSGKGRDGPRTSCYGRTLPTRPGGLQVDASVSKLAQQLSLLKALAEATEVLTWCSK